MTHAAASPSVPLTSPRCVRVWAPARLHFGLWSISAADCQPFGGVGLMVEIPAVELCVRTAPRFFAAGPLAERAEQSIRQAAQRWGMPAPPAIEVFVERTAPHHVGLGVGTQLGLAAVAALARYLDRPLPDATELAICAGRGVRSAVGDTRDF